MTKKCAKIDSVFIYYDFKILFDNVIIKSDNVILTLDTDYTLIDDDFSEAKYLKLSKQFIKNNVDKIVIIKIFEKDTLKNTFNLYIFQDIFYSDKLRADTIDELDFSIFNDLGVSEEFKTTATITLYRSPSDDLFIKQNSVESPNGLELDKDKNITIKTDKDVTLDFNIPHLKYRKFSITYEFKVDNVSFTQKITINLKLYKDIILESFDYKYFSNLTREIPDWGEKYEDSERAYFSIGELNGAQLTDMKTHLPDHNEKKSEYTYPSWLRHPDEKLVSKKNEPPVLKDAETYSAYIYLFEKTGEVYKFLYYVLFRVNIPTYDFPLYDILIIKNGTSKDIELPDTINGLVYQVNFESDDMVDNINFTYTANKNPSPTPSYKYDITVIDGDLSITSVDEVFQVYIYDDITTPEQDKKLCGNPKLNLSKDLKKLDLNRKVFPEEISNDLVYNWQEVEMDTSTITVGDARTIGVNVTWSSIDLDDHLYEEKIEYTITYIYSVTESEDGPFHSIWEIGQPMTIYVSLKESDDHKSKELFEDMLATLEDDYDTYRLAPSNKFPISESEQTKSTFIQLIESCVECGSADNICYSSNRRVNFIFYHPDKTLLLCPTGSDSFNSKMLNIREYFVDEDDVEEMDLEPNLKLDIMEEGMDDWLEITNSSSTTTIGVVSDKQPAKKFVWKTVTFTFEDANEYSSEIIYHITLISNIQKCINVVRSKEIQLELPNILVPFKDDIALAQDDTIITIPNNLKISNVLQIYNSDEYIYTVTHEGKTVNLTYNVRALTDNYIAYSRLDPVYIGKQYEYDFIDLLAIGVRITNIFCLPKGLEWDQETKISGIVNELTSEGHCPHKIVVEVEEIDCGCKEDDCDDCTFVQGNKDSCCTFDSRMFFLNIIPSGKTVKISFKPDLGELDGNVLTITLNSDVKELNLLDYIDNEENTELRYSAGLNIEESIFSHTNKKGPQTVIVIEYKDQGIWLELGKIVVNVIFRNNTIEDVLIPALIRGEQSIIPFLSLFRDKRLDYSENAGIKIAIAASIVVDSLDSTGTDATTTGATTTGATTTGATTPSSFFDRKKF